MPCHKYLWSLGIYRGLRKWTSFEIDLGSRQCGLETLSLLQTMGELGTWVFFSPQLLPTTQPQFMKPGSRGGIKSTLFLVPSSMMGEESQIKSRGQDLVQSQAFVSSCLCPRLADIPSVNHEQHIHVQNKNKTRNLSRMRCLFPVHQLILREPLPTTWHWGLRDRQCDT